MKRLGLALGLGIMMACRDRAARPVAQAAAPDSAAPVESAAAAPAAPIPSPFPADKDTARFATQLGAGAAAVPSCGKAIPRITGDSIGPFRMDETVLELQGRCPRLLYGGVMISDGYPVPTVAARVGNVTITAFASDSLPTATLTKVEVTTRGPRTEEGFGVGSTLGQIQRIYGAPQASESDCVLRVWFDSRPGLAFVMEYPASERRDCGSYSEPPLSQALEVKAVLLVPK